MRLQFTRSFTVFLSVLYITTLLPARAAASDEVVRRAPTKDKVIALTFDDGPSQTFTPKILALLQAHHAKATFFVIGERVKLYPEIVRQEVMASNQVENHTYHHVMLTGKANREIESELSESEKDILSVTGLLPHFFRPPGGHYDHKSLHILEQHGYITVLWSVDSRDWSDPGVSEIVRRVMSQVHSGDIVLFHDQGGNRTQTVQALKIILPQLEAKGYHFVTVSELLHLDFDSGMAAPKLGELKHGSVHMDLE